MTGLEFTVVFMVIAVTVVVLGLLILATIRLGVGIFKAIGLIFGRILEFIGGILGDTARIIGALVAGIFMIPLSLLNVVIGRWSAANHYADAVRREGVILGAHAWSLLVRRPLRLLFLDSMLEGV